MDVRDVQDTDGGGVGLVGGEGGGDVVELGHVGDQAGQFLLVDVELGDDAAGVADQGGGRGEQARETGFEDGLGVPGGVGGGAGRAPPRCWSPSATAPASPLPPTSPPTPASPRPRSRPGPRSTANTHPEAETASSNARCSCPRSPPCTTPPPAPTTTDAEPEERPTPKPSSALPDNGSTCSSRCSATAPSTKPEPHASLDERHRGTPPGGHGEPGRPLFGSSALQAHQSHPDRPVSGRFGPGARAGRPLPLHTEESEAGVASEGRLPGTVRRDGNGRAGRSNPRVPARRCTPPGARPPAVSG
ncbi:hypothetical protein SAURM35S_09791 [Streptomyces aurantiogriseus]